MTGILRVPKRGIESALMMLGVYLPLAQGQSAVPPALVGEGATALSSRKSTVVGREIPAVLNSSAPSPESSKGTAVAVSVVPGAIVCPDFSTTQLMFHLYTSAWESKARSVMSKGQSELVEGKALGPPNLGAYGCVLVRPGGEIFLEKGNIVPVIRTMSPRGWIRGVTLPAMVTVARVASAISAPSPLPEIHAPMRVGGEVQPPVLIDGPPSDYSEEARRRNISGEVLVYLVVDVHGDPQQVRIAHGLGAGLDENALESVSHYKFKPATLNGAAVPVEMNVSVRFQR